METVQIWDKLWDVNTHILRIQAWSPGMGLSQARREAWGQLPFPHLLLPFPDAKTVGRPGRGPGPNRPESVMWQVTSPALGFLLGEM